MQTPVFIYSKQRILEQFEKARRAFKTEIAYSVKTNPDRQIISFIDSLGSSFSVCSLDELRVLLNLKVNKEKIIFLDPSANKADYEKAVKLGITRFVVDSEEQFSELCSISKGLDVSLRLAAKTKAKGMYTGSAVFGMEFSKALRIMQKNKQMTFGLHTHIASQNTSLKAWKGYAREIKQLLKVLFIKKIAISHVNIGGGFPIPYSKGVLPIEKIAEQFDYIQRTKLIIEPGRYIIGPAGTLYTRVKTIKRVNSRNIAVVDASLYNASIDTLICGLRLAPEVEKRGKKIRYVIKGCTPDSMDIFNAAVLPELEAGDLVVFRKAGAYNFSTNFAGLKKPRTILIAH